ncbi:MULTISPECIES: nuclear transport factor 2 family protein [Streptomyces]|uniref:nuclear transport factor 2 family protein n=1 Tax=Streptomyces TaxID=1883 RepID=UPI0015928FFE|nr:MULTISPECIES: nuclear transport factor 2 family protein [Streptomyces]MCK1816857.1 nuclear transport factor 2 family protein [Streptomyces sp. XM4011]QKV69379.1 nuclear transport factor 2 family protein [Streptomyces harbinensis]
MDMLTDPAVRAFVAAVNAGDREAFRGVLTEDATMSDDGSERDLAQWTDREIFDAGGHMDIESESEDGHALIVRFRNDTWGEMRTSWRFEVADNGRVSRFETGQV